MHPVGALRLPLRLRAGRGRFSALARITGFFRGITRHHAGIEGANKEIAAGMETPKARLRTLARGGRCGSRVALADVLKSGAAGCCREIDEPMCATVLSAHRFRRKYRTAWSMTRLESGFVVQRLRVCCIMRGYLPSYSPKSGVAKFILHRVLNRRKRGRMNITLGLTPLISLIAGILILAIPRLLNYIVAIYLIAVGLIGLFGVGHAPL